ncbi:hypothetical protein AB0J74_17845 [Asanoa sp. NPDC049573]
MDVAPRNGPDRVQVSGREREHVVELLPATAPADVNGRVHPVVTTLQRGH